jgi:hypothetical protein
LAEQMGKRSARAVAADRLGNRLVQDNDAIAPQWQLDIN